MDSIKFYERAEVRRNGRLFAEFAPVTVWEAGDTRNPLHGSIRATAATLAASVVLQDTNGRMIVSLRSEVVTFGDGVEVDGATRIGNGAEVRPMHGGGVYRRTDTYRGERFGVFLADRDDRTACHSTYPTGGDSERCGWCYLNASHTDAAHAAKIAEHEARKAEHEAASAARRAEAVDRAADVAETSAEVADVVRRWELVDSHYPKARGRRFSGRDGAERALAASVPAGRFYVRDRAKPRDTVSTFDAEAAAVLRASAASLF